jgi:TubC N-terminal docking domain
MSAAELLVELKRNGIEVSRVGENLKVIASPGKVTPEQRTMIVENKTALLAHFDSDEKPPSPQATEMPTSTPRIEEAPPAVYREYVLPDGEILQVTKEEFDNVVEIYRMLWQQDQRNAQALKAA